VKRSLPESAPRPGAFKKGSGETAPAPAKAEPTAEQAETGSQE